MHLEMVVFALIGMLSAIATITLWRYKKQQFRNVFGFSLRTYTGVFGDAGAQVDAVLKYRAELFLSTCTRERTLLSSHMPDFDPYETSNEDKEDLRRIRRLVQESKQAFWFAYNLAKDNGFTLKEKVRDYVSG